MAHAQDEEYELSGLDEDKEPSYLSRGYNKYDIHEGILFCIELSESMFQKVPELFDKVQLIEILESLSELMAQLVITRPGTGIGCYFYNCKKEDSAKQIYELFPLRDINVRDMKTVSDLLDDIAAGRLLIEKMFPISQNDNGNLEALFTTIEDQFVKVVPHQRPFNNKKVFLFTDNDTPVESTSKEAKSRLRKLVDDINESYINFVTFFVGSDKKPFDDSFYCDILKLSVSQTQNNSSEFDGPNTTPISAAVIKSRVLRKQEVKRIRFQCPLILSSEPIFEVALKGYTVVTHEKYATRYKTVYEHENIRKETVSTRKYLNSKTGEDVGKTMVKVYPYGDLNIELSDEEYEKTKNCFTKKGAFLELIGFRSPEKSIYYYSNISKASFVVPNESFIKGSIESLASLFRVMRKKNRVAILWGRVSSSENPRFWVFSPTDDNCPNEGFFLYRIPFNDEIRQFPIQQSEVSENDFLELQEYQQLKRATKNILGFFNLKHGYKPSEFKNPSLQKHYKLLHDFLLQIDIKSDEKYSENEVTQLIMEDDTLKKLSQINDKILESKNSKDFQHQRLGVSLRNWNSIYKTLQDDFDDNTKFASALKKPKT